MAARTIEDVQAALDSFGLDITVQVFDEPTSTAPEAAAAIGTELGSIIKSLCFIVQGEPVLVLTAGDQRVDDKKIAALYDVGRKKVKIADAETTVSVTGYAPGGVPPVGHATQIPIFIDQTLQRFEMVYGAAGTSNSIFPIRFTDLVSITQGRIEDVVKD